MIDVDCDHPWHSTSGPDHEPIELSCPDCGDMAYPESAYLYPPSGTAQCGDCLCCSEDACGRDLCNVGCPCNPDTP